MRVVVFLDLDDTLFQTRPKCPPGETLTPAALDRAGQPLSFQTPRQESLLKLLRGAAVIPTTARNLDAFRRVTLRFDSFAVLDFGGAVLLPDGSLDAGWDAHVRPRALDGAAELNRVRERMEEVNDSFRLGVRVRLIRDFELPLYVVAKHPGGDVSALERLRREALVDLDSGRFFVHANDNNLSVVPRFLGKEEGVRYVLTRYFGGEPVLTVGAADSLTDAPFLNLCDFALLPRGSQLWRQLFPA
jgi:hypothetical protein